MGPLDSPDSTFCGFSYALCVKRRFCRFTVSHTRSSQVLMAQSMGAKLPRCAMAFGPAKSSCDLPTCLHREVFGPDMLQVDLLHEVVQCRRSCVDGDTASRSRSGWSRLRILCASLGHVLSLRGTRLLELPGFFRCAAWRFSTSISSFYVRIHLSSPGSCVVSVGFFDSSSATARSDAVFVRGSCPCRVRSLCSR